MNMNRNRNSLDYRESAEERKGLEMAMVVDEKEAELGFRYWYPLRRRFPPDSPFFASGDLERQFLAKQIALDLTEDEKQQLENMEDVETMGVFCPIVGCGAHLSSLDEFEDHYNARHTACCSVCSRVYPTSCLLSIHVSEAHDSFFQAKVARGFDMAVPQKPGSDPFPYFEKFCVFSQSKGSKYECLVEGCNIKLKSYKSRQQHLVDKHKFPASFEFLKKAHPSKKQRQKSQRKQTAPKTEKVLSAMQVEEEAINGLVSAVSKLSTSDSSPSSISFGRRHNRGLTFAPRAVQCEIRPDSSTSAGTKK
ncbi:hypothetical protein LguiB_008649 [Lonicera macranthoides]